MRVKIELDKNETIEQADELLEKSVEAKKDVSHDERYASDYLNEMHDYVVDRHRKLVSDILYQVDLEIKADASKK